jgi:hypothetical protein
VCPAMFEPTGREGPTLLAVHDRRTIEVYGTSAIYLNVMILLVERRRIELPTFALRTRRSPS